MSRHPMRITPLIAVLSLLPVAASAQDTAGPIREGFWFSLGAGLGSRGLSCEFCIGAQREQGLSTTFRVGGTISPHVTLGADLVGWIKPLNAPDRGRYRVFSSLMGVVQVYPVSDQGFFAQAGAGYIVDVVDDDLVLDAAGMTIGLGFDLRLRSRFSMTPQVKYLRTIDSALTTSLYQFAMAVTWH